MNGPDHYRRAEELAEEARKYSSHSPAAAGTSASLAQVHVTLALAAATALGTSHIETRAWVDAAGTKLSDGA